MTSTRLTPFVDSDQNQGIYGFETHDLTVSNCFFGSHKSDAIDLAGVANTNTRVTNCWVGTQPGRNPRALPIGGTGIRVGGEDVLVDSNRIARTRIGMSAQGETTSLYREHCRLEGLTTQLCTRQSSVE